MICAFSFHRTYHSLPPAFLRPSSPLISSIPPPTTRGRNQDLEIQDGTEQEEEDEVHKRRVGEGAGEEVAVVEFIEVLLEVSEGLCDGVHGLWIWVSGCVLVCFIWFDTLKPVTVMLLSAV